MGGVLQGEDESRGDMKPRGGKMKGRDVCLNKGCQYFSMEYTTNCPLYDDETEMQNCNNAHVEFIEPKYTIGATNVSHGR